MRNLTNLTTLTGRDGLRAHHFVNFNLTLKKRKKYHPIPHCKIFKPDPCPSLVRGNISECGLKIAGIVDCVDFTDQSQMLELNSLLERWPNLKPEQALQLLDYAYSDENVRRFAVRCLRQASDEQILRYLLQLVQALKHESYFQCDLVEFLLERALNNQHIGHHLFWELKAEMSSPFVGLFYGLILETYLTAAPEHLRVLERQMMLLENCRAVAVAVQRAENATKSFERGQQQFEVSVRQLFMGPRPFLNFISPLNPAQRCQRLRLERCKVM